MQITLNVPEQYLLDHTPEELGERIKLSAALLMFHAGELSAGAAAEFAEVDRYTFTAACKRYGIPVVDYTTEDLRDELDALRTAS